MICVFLHFDFRVDDGCLKFYRTNQVKIFFRSENILIIEVITHDIIMYLIIAYLLSKFIRDFSPGTSVDINVFQPFCHHGM